MSRTAAALFLIFICSIAFSWDPSTKIAVLGIDSRVKGEDIDTTSFSEIIQNTLVNRKTYIVVERAQLNKILDEQKLQSAGIAENDATRIGSIAGANKLIMGSLFKIDKEYQLLIKIIDISTGTIEIYQEIKGDSIGYISENIPSAIDEIIKKSKGENQDEVNTSVTNTETGSEVKPPRKPGFFPIQFSFVRGIALVPESFSIGGVGINVISGYDFAIYGIQVGPVLNEVSYMGGCQVGLINTVDKNIYGIQVGLINHADSVKGAQIGLINSARTLSGVQIGLINTVKEGWVGFMPIINIGF